MLNRLVFLLLATGFVAAPQPAPAQRPAPALAPDTSWVAHSALYEVFVQDFSPEGTFRGVTEGLHRIQKSGANVVWLMPIHPIGEAIGREPSDHLMPRRTTGGQSRLWHGHGFPGPGPSSPRARDEAHPRLGTQSHGGDHAWVRSTPSGTSGTRGASRARRATRRASSPTGPTWRSSITEPGGPARDDRDHVLVAHRIRDRRLPGGRRRIHPRGVLAGASPALRAAVRRPILLLAEWGDPSCTARDTTSPTAGTRTSGQGDLGRGAGLLFRAGELADCEPCRPPAACASPRTTTRPPGTIPRSPSSAAQRRPGQRSCRRAAAGAAAALQRAGDREPAEAGPVRARADRLESARGHEARAFYRRVVQLARTEAALIGTDLDRSHQRPQGRDRVSPRRDRRPGQSHATGLRLTLTVAR